MRRRDPFPTYRILKKRKGWVVQMRFSHQWFWRIFYPFGVIGTEYHQSELEARGTANICRRVDERQFAKYGVVPPRAIIGRLK